MSDPEAAAKEKLRARQAKVVTQSCLQIAAVTIVVAIAIWIVFWMYRLTILQNRLSYNLVNVYANEYRVLPLRDPAEFRVPRPYVIGEIALDRGQSDIRWKLTPTKYNYTVSSIDIRGPLTSSSPFSAAVVFPLGTQYDSRHRRYEGIISVDARLLENLMDRPYAYYVSFSDENGTEFMRDALDKIYHTLE